LDLNHDVGIGWENKGKSKSEKLLKKQNLTAVFLGLTPAFVN